MLCNIKNSLIILSITFSIYACKSESAESIELILTLEKNTELLNEALENSTAANLYSLKQKSENPHTMGVAYQYFEKADKIQKHAKNIVKYIDLKSTHGLFERKFMDTLYTVSIAFQKEIRNQDPYAAELVEQDFKFIHKLFADIGIGDNPKANTSFEKLNKLEQTAFLGLVKSRTMYLTNRTIRYYDQIETSSSFWHFGTYTSLVTQNTKTIAPEGELEIYAGIGEFSKATKPTITFNGNSIPLNDYGYATFKNKAPKDPGNYTIPVQISFFNQTTGKDETKLINVEYQVAKSCQ